MLDSKAEVCTLRHIDGLRVVFGISKGQVGPSLNFLLPREDLAAYSGGLHLDLHFLAGTTDKLSS